MGRRLKYYLYSWFKITLTCFFFPNPSFSVTLLAQQSAETESSYVLAY